MKKKKKELVIVSLTTWKERIGNVPVVLDSIFSQTVCPDLVVLNLAYEEVIPEEVADYLSMHSVEIIRVPDTKVYKKIIPTLYKYPEACVINIDDDFEYPKAMIADFLSVHRKHPRMPVTGNYICLDYMNCHCGCASLTKKEYFGKWLDRIDAEVMANCPSDDMVYTYFCAKSGHYYVRTKETYFVNMKPVSAVQSYSARFTNPEQQTWDYLVGRFGSLPCRNYVGYLFAILITRLGWR